MTDDLRAIVHAALLTPSPLSKHQDAPHHRHAAYDGFTLHASGQPGANLNYAIVFGPVAPDQFWARAAAFFGVDAAFSVEIEVGAAQAVEDDLQSRGWVLDEEEPALVLHPLPATFPAPPAGLAIRPVASESDFAAFMAITRTSPAYLPSFAATQDPDVALLVGYVDSEAVATARMSVLGAVADIMGITTVSEARRRGYGTAMTWAAIAESARRGCTAATLTATEMGYPIYVRMGFRPVCAYRTYLPPE